MLSNNSTVDNVPAVAQNAVFKLFNFVFYHNVYMSVGWSAAAISCSCLLLLLSAP